MESISRILLLAAVFGLIAASLPASGSEVGIYNPLETPTPTTMYFHIDGIQDFPINTQLPDDRYARSEGLGTVTHSQGCVENPGGTLVADVHHTYYGYSSPGYVEYDFEQDGGPRYHKERGISFDVQLQPDSDVELYWFMESQLFGGEAEPNPNNVPAVTPNVVVRATVREGDAISVGHVAMNTGPIIARGETTATTLAGQFTQLPDDGSVFLAGGGNGGAPQVYGFKVLAPVEKAIIDKDEAYNVRIDVYMEGMPCEDPQGDEYVMADWLRPHTSPGNRPQLTWTVMNPLRIEYLHPQFIGDDLVIHTSTNSPWGNYDVCGDRAAEPPGCLAVRVEGPSIPVSFDQVAIRARTHEHDHHTEAVDATWVWEYKKDGAQNGLYTVTLTAKNDQETAEALAIAQFEVGTGSVIGCGGQAKGGGESECVPTTGPSSGAGVESPGAGFLAGLAALAVGLLRRRV